jgi:hypothetical protein
MRALGKGSLSSFLAALLNGCWYLVAFVLALMVLLVVLSPFVEEVPGLTMMITVPRGPDFTIDIQETSAEVPGLKMTIPVSFSVDARTHRVTAPLLGIEDAHIQHVRGSLRFPVRKGAFFYGNAILLIVLLAVALWVLGQLRAVFRTLREGRPFVPANATRIRRIAFVIIAGELARSAMVFVENRYVMTHFSADGLRFDAWPDLNGLAIISGLIILVIAEVFRAGTRLDEEQSLTV